MNIAYEEIEATARKLSGRRKAELARVLIADLESQRDDDVASLWVEEAERRLSEFDSGVTQAFPGPEVFARLRERLRS